MPKRSQEYRDARRDQILAAAKRCFVRNGFHETSMQDLFAEADLSAGAVYRYFASKDDVIVAIAEANLRDVLELIHTFAADPRREGLGATIAAILELVRARHADDHFGALTLLAWSEVLRNPRLHERFAQSLSQLRTDLAGVVRQRQRAKALPGDVDAEGIAAVVLAVVPGLIVQMTILGDQAMTGVGEAARALWPE